MRGMDPALDSLTAGMAVLYGGNRVTRVSSELAAGFQPGDRLLVDGDTGALLHVPAAAQAMASEAVGRAAEAFAAIGAVSDATISDFFDRFAALLEGEAAWAPIAAANAADVARAAAAGRPVGRLAATPAMRAEMIAGLRGWRDAGAGRGRVVERI